MMDVRAIPSRLDINDLRTPEDHWFSRNVRIVLDGVEQTRVVRYDLDKYEIERYALDEYGNPATVKKPDGEWHWATEVVTGRIEVSFREGAV